MRLPRRVPWASLEELERVCSKIYTDSNDLDSQKIAINRISAWRAITTLPHAIESTLALLVVIVQDTEKKTPSSTLFLRQSYASAIIRLVNGLVDPLQVGTYARPIGAIAQQLGLPGWLVELRHAATHEQLPSIELLREAARQSMSWLLHNFYLPMLNKPSDDGSQEPEVEIRIRPLVPLLKAYKGAMKTMTRDVSLVPHHRGQLVTILRDMERWMSECKVAANVANGIEDVDWARSEDDETARGIWALERFCDGLLEKGMLVPLSKKKRLRTDDFLPSKASISFWEVLLHHVHSLHPGFPSVFCHHLLSALLAQSSKTEKEQDSSYNLYLATWVMWAVETWEEATSPSVDLRKDIITALLKEIYPFSSAPSGHSTFHNLVNALISKHEGEYEALKVLILQLPAQRRKSTWSPNDLEIMAQRYESLQQAFQNQKGDKEGSALGLSETPVDSFVPTSTNSMQSGYDKNDSQVQTTSQERERMDPEMSITGWRLLRSTDDGDGGIWKPCPLGVFYGPSGV